jgi:general secretion pathway protein A
LLQILLVGQPELDEKLDSVELRQLKQRIALRSHLLPLDLEETRGYIQRRLHLAGANSSVWTIFPEETLAEVYRHSRGLPRLINSICENALIGGYARQLKSITPDIIGEVAADLRLNLVRTPRTPEIAINDGAELWQAIKTLLQTHKQLNGMRSGDAESLVSSISGAKTHEPFI